MSVSEVRLFLGFIRKSHNLNFACTCFIFPPFVAFSVRKIQPNTAAGMNHLSLLVFRLRFGLHFRRRFRVCLRTDVRLIFGVDEHALVALGAVASLEMLTDRRVPKIACIPFLAFAFSMKGARGFVFTTRGRRSSFRTEAFSWF